MSWIKIDENLYINDTAPFSLEKRDSNWYVIDSRDKSKFIPISDIYNNPVFPVDLQNQDVIVKSLQALNNISGNSLDITNNAKAKHFRGDQSNDPLTPLFSSQGDPDTGFFHISSGKFGFSSNGIKTLEFDQNLTVFNNISGNSLDITNNAKAKHFRGDQSNDPLTPSFSSQEDPDTGFFHISSGKFGFSSNGIKTLEFDQNLTVFNKSNLMPVGTIIQSALLNPPTGFLFCNGAEYSRTNYSDLFLALPFFSNNITFTIASPCVVTWNSHGLATGQSLQFTTTGTLPTGITSPTVYYIRKINNNTFNLYNTLLNAMNTNFTTGIINTSGTQSGIHTAFSNLYGNGDGVNTFNVPDLRGASPRGAGTSFGYIEPAILTLGEKTDDQFQSHRHFNNPDNYTVTEAAIIGGTGRYETSGTFSTINYSTTGNPTSDPSSGTFRTGKETRAKTQAFNFYIKF